MLYGVEGRGYALASLLALLAFERALALRDRPRAGTGAALALCAAGAVLTHYLAVFPVAALSLLALSARPAARRALVLAGLGAAALAAPWIRSRCASPPRDRVGARSRVRGRAPGVSANLAFGIEPAGALALPFALLGGALLLALLFRERRGVLAPVAAVLSGSLVLLALAQLATGALVLPGRTAVVFLPFVALLLAAAPPAVPLAAGHPRRRVSRARPARRAPARRPARRSRGSSRGPRSRERRSRPPATGGRSSITAWRARGLPGRVILFPSAVAAHPGWYREEEIPTKRSPARPRRSSRAHPRPTVFVLPRGSRASAALASRLGPGPPPPREPDRRVVETRPAPGK